MSTSDLNLQKRILITGGRAPAALELARQFRKSGCLVFLAESLPVYLSRRSSAVSGAFSVRAPNQDPDGFAEDLARIAHEASIDVILPTCEEVFFVARAWKTFRALFPAGCEAWVDDPEKLRLLHSKWDFNLVAQQTGPVPCTRVLTSMSELREAVRSANAKEGFVLKPVFSRFAAKTMIVPKTSQIEWENRIATLLQDPPSPLNSQNPWVFQRFLTGSEYCSYGVAREGKLLAHVTYFNRFRAGRGAGIAFEVIHHAAIEDWVTRFVADQEFTGQIAFDFIESEDGTIRPLECNPRATSGVHFFDCEPLFASVLAGVVSSDRTSGATLLSPPTGRLRMLALAMLTYGVGSVRGLRSLREWFHVFSRSGEVIFKRDDFRPFFDQFSVLLLFWRHSRRNRVSLLEASTYDIEWDGVR